MIITIASGKGGTGKTTVAVNLALSLNDVQFIDCDVEEPNAHIFFKPQIIGRKNGVIPIPVVNKQKCNFCGKCMDICRYNAIVVLKGNDTIKNDVILFSHLCHGCGACNMLCPENAITEKDKEIGEIEFAKFTNGQFIHGILNPGEAMAPPLIRQVKESIDTTKTVIIDAPPGTSCPAINAIKGSDFSLLVTEPTPFGLNDLILAVEVLRKLQISFGVIINRFDIGDKKVEEYCANENIPVLMKIPFNKEIAIYYSQGVPIIEKIPHYKDKFNKLYSKIIEIINSKH